MSCFENNYVMASFIIYTLSFSLTEIHNLFWALKIKELVLYTCISSAVSTLDHSVSKPTTSLVLCPTPRG